MEHEASEGDPLGGEDPFEGLVFDEDFIRSASISEPSAEQRQREARQANLQRLLADQAAERENEQHATRRYAPDDDDPFGEYDRPPRRRTGRLVIALVVVMAIIGVYVLSQFFAGNRRRPDDTAPSVTSTSAPASTSTLPTTTIDPGAAGAGTAGAGTAEDGTDPAAAGSVDQGAAASMAAPVVAANSTRPADWPPVSTEQQATPLGTPAAVPAGGGAHAFVQLQSDGTSPVAYDPCRPIHYVTRTPGVPAGAESMVRDAIATVSAATGLVFVDDGATDEAPSDTRESYQPDRYGRRWSPVLITWSDPTESPRLVARPATTTEDGADVLAYAGSSSAGYEDDGRGEAEQHVFVSGTLVLDAPDFVTMLGQFDGYARARAVVLHELGHLVGLNHVDDATQLMSPVLRSDVTEFAAGDLQGLAAVGSGACAPQI